MFLMTISWAGCRSWLALITALLKKTKGRKQENTHSWQNLDGMHGVKSAMLGRRREEIDERLVKLKLVRG